MAELFSIYKNESGSVEYDRFSEKHAEDIRKGIEESIPDDVYRMARAFPTFKVFFIEEDAPNWGLDDDVYGYNSVTSIVIHKSRKNAADMAVVQFTNFEGKLDNKDFKAKDHADSTKETFNPRAKKEQETFEKMMLRPGTRVQIKLGYSPNANELQNVFTGKVTSVEYGDMVTFEAQGYGIELLHDIGFDFWKEKFRARYADPRYIINRLLKGREVKHFGRWGWSNYTRYPETGWFRIDNPVDDNIFLEESNWFINLFKWAREFRVYHTTAWEVIQDISKRFPGYIASVVPFDERATLFFGLPTEPYTHTEVADASKREEIHKNPSGGTLEDKHERTKKDLFFNQKIFRDYHYKDSAHHIIANNIKINMDNFFNRIVIQYYEDIGGKTPADQAKAKVSTVTLMADDTIEEEYWKTKVIFEENCETSDQAYNYALGNLLLYLKELYDGELVVMGDPKIKPYDIVYIYDNFTNMYGPIEVREVVHNFDREGGFVTRIIPDLLVHINNPFQFLDATFASRIAASMASASIIIASDPKLRGLLPYVAGAIAPEVEGTFWPMVFARLGWSEAKREPIGVSPLVYAGKPYIAGFEGMKSESYIVRTIEGWTKYVDHVVQGVYEGAYALTTPGRRR